MTRPRFQLRIVHAAVGASILLGLLARPAPAAASTIVYQCGSNVCAIDPDHPATTQRTVKANATAAGTSSRPGDFNCHSVRSIWTPLIGITLSFPSLT